MLYIGIGICIFGFLSYVAYKLFRYDVFKNMEIPANLKAHTPQTLEEKLLPISRIAVDRKTARKILRDVKKNPKLRPYLSK